MTKTGSSNFELQVPAPFRLDLTVWALRRRPHNAVDDFDGDRYRRSLVAGGRVHEVVVRQVSTSPEPRVAVELRSDGARPGARAEADVRRVLDRSLGLHVDLGAFYRLARRDPRLTTLAARFYGMRPPRFPSVFEALVNAIACQQLSLTVGIHLLNRLASRYGPVPRLPGASAAFPAPEQLAHAELEDLRSLGFSRAKAAALVGVAGDVATGAIDLEALNSADDESARAALLGIRGVGRWSAEYTMLRGLGRLQVLPGDDVGAQNNLRRRYGLDESAGYDELSALARAWSPYGGLVYFHLLLDALADVGRINPMRQGPSTAGG